MSIHAQVHNTLSLSLSGSFGSQQRFISFPSVYHSSVTPNLSFWSEVNGWVSSLDLSAENGISTLYVVICSVVTKSIAKLF